MKPPAGWQREVLAAALPWLVYRAGLAAGQPSLGAGLALAGWALVRAAAWRNTKVFELAISLFFMLVWLWPEQLLASRPGVVIPALLGLMALGSVLAGQPCTLQYARLTVGPEWWRNRHFIAVNRVLTLLWGVCFVLSAGLSLLAVIPAPGLGLLQAGLYAGALWYTRTYPRWYRLHRYLPLVRSGREVYLKPPPKYR